MYLNLVMVCIFLVIIFRKRLWEEYVLISQREAHAILDEGIYSQYIPYSGKERDQLVVEHLNSFKHLQERLSKSLLAKYFIDYSKNITENEKAIQEKKQLLKGIKDDYISFSTINLSQVIADPSFDDEMLLAFADFIDEMSEKLGKEFEFITLEKEEEIPFVSIRLDADGIDNEQEIYFQGCVNEIASSLLKSEKVKLEIVCKGEEQKFLFNNKNS